MINPIASPLIRFREFAINLTLRIPVSEVLNPQPTGKPLPASPELSQQIKQSVNQFKRLAMDSTGRKVDYSKLSTHPSYLDYVRQLVPRLRHFNLSLLASRESATAFWINLYNALVIHAVIEYRIRKSISAGGFASQVRFFRQASYQVGGFRFSLEDIEHGILRANRGNPLQFSPQFPPNDPRNHFVIQPLDPRIHFALNCASLSCPPISVYDPQKLNRQLDLATTNYIHQETSLTRDGLAISKLFDWYKKDFGSIQGIAAFILDYLPQDERKFWLKDNLSSPRFSFLPYDWVLNT